MPGPEVSASVRPLGAAHGAALVVAGMIGTGIFTTTGMLLASLGSPWLVLLIWVVAGLLALCGAAVYAELGAMMPRAGGEYVYLSRAFHPAVGFLSGWIGLLVGFAAPSAASALAFGRYLHALAPALPQKPLALGLIVVVTAAHLVDVRFGARLQTGLTGLVVLLIAVFIAGAAGFGHGSWAHLAAAASAGGPGAALGSAGPPVTAGALALGLVLVSYAYFGWNTAAYVAGEIRDPARSLPRALVAGAGLVTVLYVALNLVFLWAVPPDALAGQIEVGHVVAGALFGPRGAMLLSSLVALALAGSVSAFMMAGPRITIAMAEDGLFFRALGRAGARGAPTGAVALQGALAFVVAATATFEPILVYVGFTLTLSSGATVLAAFVLRRREPDAPRPHRALAWPLSGLLFLASAIFMTSFAIHSRPRESAASLLTLLAGGVAYMLWRRRR
ncbi:MAG TPA: amino acid permease [Polyangia bacterium]|jgi:APA family basic amino acid/polyamine antiporter|nr:amino acid permease [Polyangia bacterium]